MTPLLTLPLPPPTWGAVRLRAFEERDVDMVRDLSTDPYVPLVGTLPAHAELAQARSWVDRQHERLTTGLGYSFCVADVVDDRALGQAGLWLTAVGQGRAAAGYGVAPAARGRGVAADALRALTGFAWTDPRLHRVELYVEPWNTASLRTAERAGYLREGLLRSHQVIGGRRADMVVLAALRPVDVPG